jgi:outer membrane protein assembly factor BamB
MVRRIALALFVSAVLGNFCHAADWPQWMGPTRNGIWAEEGILETFPKAGPKKLWSVPIGGGYAGPAVANGKVFITDYQRKVGDTANDPGKKNKLDGQERVLCLDAATGKELWKHEYDRKYELSYPAGPRTTPTVDGEFVFTLGSMGDLFCLDANKGSVIWSKDFVKDYQAPVPQWGFCGHPLVEDNLLICLVGGNGSVAVAFDKKTGKEVWKKLSAKDQGYCPPAIITAGGKRQLLIYHSEAIHALNPATGEEYWKVELKPSYGMSINAPQQYKDFLFAGGIGNVAVMLKLHSDSPAVSEVWRGGKKSEAVYPANATPLMLDGTLYGCDSMTGEFRAVDLATGKVFWATHEPTNGKESNMPHGTAFAVKNADRYFLFSETGHLIIARLTPEKYEELSRTKLLEPTGESFGRKVVWSHPAFANKKVFARNDSEIVCYDLSK